MSYYVIFQQTRIGVDRNIGRGQFDEIRFSYPSFEDAERGKDMPPPNQGYVARKIVSDAGEVLWCSLAEYDTASFLSQNPAYRDYVKDRPWLHTYVLPVAKV